MSEEATLELYYDTGDLTGGWEFAKGGNQQGFERNPLLMTRLCFGVAAGGGIQKLDATMKCIKMHF